MARKHQKLVGSAVGLAIALGGASAVYSAPAYAEGTVSVGDRVWWDWNHNGVQDPREPGIPGVELSVVGDGVRATTTTDADGMYEFMLPAGTAYTVRVDLESVYAADLILHPSHDPTGPDFMQSFSPTLTGQGTPETDSSTGSVASTVLVGDGDSDPTLDFGFWHSSMYAGLAPYYQIDTYSWGVNAGKKANWLSLKAGQKIASFDDDDLLPFGEDFWVGKKKPWAQATTKKSQIEAVTWPEWDRSDEGLFDAANKVFGAYGWPPITTAAQLEQAAVGKSGTVTVLWILGGRGTRTAPFGADRDNPQHYVGRG